MDFILIFDFFYHWRKVDGREIQEHVFYLNEVWFYFSSIDIEVIRTVLIFIFFYEKILSI